MVAPFKAPLEARGKQGKQGKSVHPRGDRKYAQPAENGKDVGATSCR